MRFDNRRNVSQAQRVDEAERRPIRACGGGSRSREALGVSSRDASHRTEIDDELEAKRRRDAAQRREAPGHAARLESRHRRLRASDPRGQLGLRHPERFACAPHPLRELEGLLGAAVAVAPSGGLLPRALDGVPARAVSHPSRPPCRALPQSYFPLSEPPTLLLRRRVLRPRRRPSGFPSHTTAASGCMTSTGESAKPRGSRVTMALQPAASAAAAQTASSKSRHPRVNARLITEWSTGATRNTVSRSPTTRRA